jgi:DNA ligase-1
MNATSWEEDKDPTGWHLSEKFDGMRLYWNENEFYSRQGKKINVPKSLTSQLPKISLDGELW